MNDYFQSALRKLYKATDLTKDAQVKLLIYKAIDDIRTDKLMSEIEVEYALDMALRGAEFPGDLVGRPDDDFDEDEEDDENDERPIYF